MADVGSDLFELDLFGLETITPVLVRLEKLLFEFSSSLLIFLALVRECYVVLLVVL